MDRIPIPTETLEALKGKYGKRLRTVTISDEPEEFAIIVPSREGWKKFVTLLADDDTKAEAFEAIAIECVVHPAPFEPLLDDRPALAMTLGDKVGELAGLHKRADVKKP